MLYTVRCKIVMKAFGSYVNSEMEHTNSLVYLCYENAHALLETANSV